jgi:oleandomycin transport system permease protein
VHLVPFPLALVSSVFLPTVAMPGWLQAFADNRPISTVANALRGLMLGGHALPPGQTVAGQALLALGWRAASLAVFAPMAVQLAPQRQLTRAVSHSGQRSQAPSGTRCPPPP